MKNNIFGEDENSPNEVIKKEPNPSRLNDIIDNLNNLYKDKTLKDLANNSESQEISKLAGTFIMELEVFLSTNEKV